MAQPYIICDGSSFGFAVIISRGLHHKKALLYNKSAFLNLPTFLILPYSSFPVKRFFHFYILFIFIKNF